MFAIREAFVCKLGGSLFDISWVVEFFCCLEWFGLDDNSNIDIDIYSKRKLFLFKYSELHSSKNETNAFLFLIIIVLCIKS